MLSSRVSSSNSPNKTIKLPELPIPKGKNITYDDINEIKLKTQQMDQECKQLKSKTQRMKQVAKERKNTIKHVFSQTQDKQSIKTASPNTLKMLNETAKSLETSLDMHRQELEELKKCDKLQLSKELEIEIQMYYLEQKRLKQKSAALHDDESRISGIQARLRTQIRDTKANERAVDDLQEEINSLTDKYFAYTKSDMHLYSTNKLKKLHNNPKLVEKIRSEIQADIDKEKAEIDANKNEIKRIQSKEERNTKFLQQLIDEQAQIIREKNSSDNR